MNLISQIRSPQNRFTKAEAKIASIILDGPEAIVEQTTAELARAADVSDPMISRFCKSLGYRSFPAFKVALAASLASDQSLISESVRVDDDADTYIDKRIKANINALNYLHKRLDNRTIETAVEHIARSEQLLIFGSGGNASVAQDAQHKLFRLGIPTVAYSDQLMQRMASAAANAQSCVLLFSVTGRTKTTIEVAQTAKSTGAVVIAITSPKSPLAKAVDVVIDSGDTLEDTTLYVPMTTRMVILTIIDILVTGAALARGPNAEQTLKAVKQSLEATKF